MKKYLQEILYLLGDDRRKLAWLILLFISSSMLDVIGLGLIGPYVALVVTPESFLQGAVGQFLQSLGFSLEPKDLLITVGLGLVGVFFLKAIIGIVITKVILQFSWDQQTKLRNYLMQSYMNLPYTDYLKRNSSDYVNTIQGLVAQFAVNVVESLLRLLSEGIVSLAIILLLAWTNGPVLALLVALMGGIMLTYDRFFRANVKQYGENTSIGSERMYQGINEGIEGFKEVRVLGRQSYFQQMVLEGSKKVSENSIKASMIMMSPRYLLQFILIVFIVLVVVGTMALGGDVISLAPTLGVFGVASLRLMPTTNLLVSGVTQIRFSRHATSRLYADLKDLEQIKSPKEQISLLSQDEIEPFSELSLNNLKFRYVNAKQWALQDLTLSINAGESIGLIGPSGAGKTTLVDVLLGLLEPNEGELLYNGHSMRLALSDWRKQVAYSTSGSFPY